MEIRKSTIGIVTAAIILLSLLALPLLIVKADVEEWYTGKSGVLDSDYYLLYPFEKNSLTIGFSKFGEMINPYTGHGLNYSGRDPFANEGVAKKYWLNGWFIDIRYVHRVEGARHLWAMATFADMISYGGDWLNEHTDPYGSPHGGRKCSGIAVTDPVTVLYNGPRRFVAIVRTHLNDTVDGDTWEVADVILTIIFNKVKKEIVVLKDVKLTIDSKILESPVNVQFSNRGEWDLGPSPDWKSYAHFYHQQFETCFGAAWHLSKNITREFYYLNNAFSGSSLTLPYESADTYYYSLPVVWRSEYVYVNDVWQRPGIDYTINYNTGVITFSQSLTSDKVEVYYKLYKHEGERGQSVMALPHQYDLAQIIARDKAVVGYAAFWPVLSDYTVDGWDRALEPLYNTSESNMLPVPSEPDIPYVIGEWDFMLDYDTATTNWGEQFRGVTVYGVVNYHDADDVQGSDLNGDGAVENQVDVEVRYQLNEVFNPWDLYDAVHKDTQRWVQFYTVTADDVYLATLGYPLLITLSHSPVLYAPIWEEYCNFSERVIWGGALKFPLRSVYSTYHYELSVADDGTGTITIPATKVPAAGTEIKILYSTETYYAYNETENPISLTFESEETPANGVVELDWDVDDSWIDYLGVSHSIEVDGTLTLTEITDITGNYTFTLTGSFNWFSYDFKVFKEDYTWLGIWDLHLPPANITVNGNTTEIDPSDFDIEWTVNGPAGLDLHVEFLDAIINYNFTATYNTQTGNYTIEITIDIEPYGGMDTLYVERIPGRYEWTVLGRDAHTSDSLGASLVTAAFKNKQIEIGLSGMDMMYYEWMQASIPYVMNCFGTAPGTRTDYKDDGSTPGQRPALRDDWCTTWPISSSNMIGVGGPLANVFTLYFNEFTDAFYGTYVVGWGETYTPYATWQNKIIALTCWNGTLKAYGASLDTGYAVIATYKDINGTVGFVIWGLGPRDTYYASKFFHEEIIFELQRFPLCVTSIIIEIDYADPQHPTFSVVECLGTISERAVHEDSLTKGGIHPDP